MDIKSLIICIVSILFFIACRTEEDHLSIVTPYTNKIDENDFTFTKAVSNMSLQENKINIYRADFLGTDKEEYLIVCGRNCFILNENMRTLRTFSLPDDFYIPALIFDFDHDNKMDIIFGTENAPRPEIIVFNGYGNCIGRIILMNFEEDCSKLFPSAIVNKRMYVTTVEDWPDRPRGISAFELPEFKKLWFFHLPVDPVSVSVQLNERNEEILIINHRSLATSLWRYLGKQKEFIDMSDIYLQFISINREGELIGYRDLVDTDGNRFQGEVEFLTKSLDYGSQLDVHIRDSEGNSSLYIFSPMETSIHQY